MQSVSTDVRNTRGEHWYGVRGCAASPHTIWLRWMWGLLLAVCTDTKGGVTQGMVCRRRCYQKAMAGMSTHGYR